MNEKEEEPKVESERAMNWLLVMLFDDLRSGAPVLVNICRTHSDISLILLHVWFGPSCKRFEITKSLNIVIVSVPKRYLGYWWASRCAPKDALPLIIGWVYPWSFSEFGDSFNQTCQKSTVISSWVSLPWTPRTWISLNINPNSWEKISWYSIEHGVDLCERIFSSTREHVNIWGKTCCFGILKVSICICIQNSWWPKCSYDGKWISTVLETSKCWDRSSSIKINSIYSCHWRYEEVAR